MPRREVGLCAVMLACLLAGHSTAKANCVFYVPFTNGSPRDTIGGRVPGTVGGGPTADRDGQADSAWLLHSDPCEYLDYGDDAGLRGFSALTVACEFKANSWYDWQAEAKGASLVTKNNSGDGSWNTDTYSINLYRNDGKYWVSGILYSTAGRSQLGAYPADVIPTFDPFGWHEVYLTYDGAETKLWLDGILLGSEAFTGTVNDNSGVPLRIGKHFGTSTHNGCFDGVIDEVWICDEALVPPAAIPEPLTLFGAIAGVGALGGYLRRRQGASLT
jgi:hypothetical protein